VELIFTGIVTMAWCIFVSVSGDESLEEVMLTEK